MFNTNTVKGYGRLRYVTGFFIGLVVGTGLGYFLAMLVVYKSLNL